MPTKVQHASSPRSASLTKTCWVSSGRISGRGSHPSRRSHPARSFGRTERKGGQLAFEEAILGMDFDLRCVHSSFLCAAFIRLPRFDLSRLDVA